MNSSLNFLCLAKVALSIGAEGLFILFIDFFILKLFLEDGVYLFASTACLSFGLFLVLSCGVSEGNFLLIYTEMSVLFLSL